MQPDDELARRRKKIIFGLIVSIFLIIALQLLWKYIHTGKLVLSSDESVSFVVTNKANEEVYAGDKNVTVSLPTGLYTITATNRTSSIQRQAVVKGNKTTEVRMLFPKESQLEPSLSLPVSNLFVNGGELLYRSTTSGRVIHISNNKTYSQPINRSYTSVVFTSTSTGYGLGTDGLLYHFNIATSKENVVRSLDSSLGIAIDVSPNGTTYVANGKGVYVLNSNDTLKKIYTSDFQTTPGLVAGNSSLALVGTTITTFEDAPVIAQTLEFISVDGKRIGSVEPTVSDSQNQEVGVAWSPDEKQVAITDVAGVSLYDSNLKKLTAVSTRPSTKPVWLSDHELVYSNESSIRKYNTTDELDSQFALMALDKSIQELVVDMSRDYLYAVVSMGDKTTTYRAPLKGQTLDQTSFRLAPYMPMLLSDECDVNYINTNGLSLLLLTDQESASLCQSTTQTTLQKYGLPTTIPIQTVL
ncbi:hypothetical protein JNM87_06885 [Candidatus Saccharibacteria bacterium]|nr:hypothetical protein [Candidatus Saccharibacteria bacterium]